VKKNYPYTIENGKGERLTFLGVKRDADGERAEAEGLAQPGSGAPMHVHHLQEEAVRVISGRVGYQNFGEEPKFAGPGEVVIWPAGTPHKWWNAGDTELRTSGWCRPADNMEFFLGTLFESTKANGGKGPGFFDAAYLLTRYRLEYDMLEMPLVVRRVVFPIVYVIGRVLGKYGKFKDAPSPIRRDRTR
jgi:mannose-6-phosphate isomerase-like protein (cupin superfamily)